MAIRQINSDTISTNQTLFKKPKGSNIDPSLQNALSSRIVYLSEGSSADYLKKRSGYQRKTNSFFEHANDYTITSIKYGEYIPYLPKGSGNNVLEPVGSDNFYTEYKGLSDQGRTDRIIKSENIAISNNVQFFIGKFNKKNDNKIFIKPQFLNRAYDILTEQEYQFVTEIYDSSDTILNVLWSADVAASAVVARYVAPPNGFCGVCQAYAYGWGAGTSFACDGSDGPVPDGFVFTSGGPDLCSVNASGLFPEGPVFADIPQNVKDFLGETEFGGLINYFKYPVGDTYDTQEECNAYDLDPLTSGYFEWMPAIGLTILNEDDIPGGYSYCSEKFFLIS